MKILSIPPLVHDSSICILNDGKIELYKMEERFSRVKHDYGMDHILKILIEKYNNQYFDIIIISKHFLDQYTYSDENIKKKIENLKYGKLIYEGAEHHLYHAYSGFYNSGFNEAICFSVDASGAILKNGNIEIESVYYLNREEKKNFIKKLENLKLYHTIIIMNTMKKYLMIS